MKKEKYSMQNLLNLGQKKIEKGIYVDRNTGLIPFDYIEESDLEDNLYEIWHSDAPLSQYKKSVGKAKVKLNQHVCLLLDGSDESKKEDMTIIKEYISGHRDEFEGKYTVDEIMTEFYNSDDYKKTNLYKKFHPE